MNSDPTVFVIDDDAAFRESTAALLASVQVAVQVFSAPAEFLAMVNPARRGCVIADTHLPGLAGLDFLSRLAAWEPPLPVILVTAHGDIPMAVEAMRRGAVDFIEKPVRDQVLLERVHEALHRDAAAWRARALQAALVARMARLTPRERDVMVLVVKGQPNKAIAEQLGVSRKAVEAYRARLMRKMQARSLAVLVRMNLALHATQIPAETRTAPPP